MDSEPQTPGRSSFTWPRLDAMGSVLAPDAVVSRFQSGPGVCCGTVGAVGTRRPR